VARTRQLRIDLLGRFRLALDGVPVRESVSSRGRELLALLVLEGGARLRRERVASRLWPDSSEEQSRTNLRRELHQLRRDLPQVEWALETSDGQLGVRLDDGVASDVQDVRAALARAGTARAAGRGEVDGEIAALTAAAQSYGGDLMPECFADWVAPARDRLREDVVTGLRRLTALLEERRDLGEAIRWARRLTEIDALDEIAYRAQMRLHAAASERASALHAFHRCATLLERELGAEPEPETRALYREILGERASDAGRLPEAPDPRPPVAHQTGEAWALVGRGDARVQLAGAWRAIAGRPTPALARPMPATGPRVVCIVGEPGIGKSRLADEVAREAERGADVARSRAYAAEGQLSYAPVVDWLRSATVFPRLADLDPIWRAEIGRLLPEMAASATTAEHFAEPVRSAPPPPSDDDTYPRQRLFEAIARALLGGARPVVLVLDDLQWCDPETSALLHYLDRYEGGAPRLVVTTARGSELGDNDAAQRLLGALRQDGRLLEIELGPLSEPDVLALLQAAAGSARDAVTAEMAARVHRLSEGNPLFAIEALRADLHRGEARPDASAASDAALPGDLLARSPRVRAVLTARLDQLGPRARELSECAATIGRAFSYDVLREAADLDEHELVPALDELWRRRIVREHPTLGYDFSHDTLREAAAQTLSPARARLLHRRVAQALEIVHAASLDEVSASLAAHYERAGLAERATGYYRRAAHAASAVYAHRRAVALLERALALVARRPASRARDVEELAVLLALTPSLRAVHGYADPRLLAVLERAGGLAEALGDTASLFQALRNLWALRFVGGDLRETLAIATRLRELAGVKPELAAESHHALAGPLAHVGDLTTALEHFEAARRCYDPTRAERQLSVFGSDVGVFNGAWEAHALWLSGLEDRAVASARDAERRAQDLTHAYSQALAHAYAAVLHYMRRDRAACAEAADAARAVCERHGFAYYRHWGTLMAAWARADADPDGAVAAMREALASLDAEGAWARRPIYLAAYAEALTLAGRREDARATLDLADARAAASGESVWSSEVARLRVDLDPEHAVEHARRSLALARELGARPLALRSAVTLAQVLGAIGKGAEGQAIVREVLAGLPDAGGSRERASALALLASGR
jgi:DNA-binding SARP family transcriptional activator